MKWTVKDNILAIQLSANTYFVPSTKSIYEALNRGNYFYDNTILEFPKTIRFSKIGFNAFLNIFIEDKDIKLSMYVKRGDNKYFIPFLNGSFADSCVIENTWHYLTNNFVLYSDVLKNIEIKENGVIDYLNYIKLKRKLEELNIEFYDDVISYISEINDETSFYIPKLLKANLYEYQRVGSRWLTFMALSGCGALLADEMGLGKTLQIISTLAYLKENSIGNHFLVIAPVSLLENWKREIEKFYPSFKTLIHHGSRRTGFADVLLKFDIIITTYSNVQTDLTLFNMITWDCLVLDEAQNIKNPTAQRTKIIKSLNRKIGIAVTGTPFENHVTDLWSLVDFIIPNFLGSLSEFNSNFDDSIDSAVRLEKIITPFMIRRKVIDVAKDLPRRIDIPHPITMTSQEASYYENNRKILKDKNPLMNISLDAIQSLRKFCTHPCVYNPSLDSTELCHLSNKYQLLCDLLDEIVLSKEKALVFTSYTNMIKLMLDDFSERYRVYVNFINGDVSSENRQKIVDEFSDTIGPAILILNPKAAGTGLNITAANHVIHYNLEWNPAVEDQASARAYRRGQQKTVFIHRLFYVKTIEEFMNDKLYTKRELSDSAIIGNKGQINKEDLIKALDISPEEM